MILILNPTVAKVEDAVDPRRQGWATTELSRSQAVVNYREPLTSLRQGFGPAGNKGDAVPSTFPTCLAEASAKAGG